MTDYFRYGLVSCSKMILFMNKLKRYFHDFGKGLLTGLKNFRNKFGFE